MSNMSVSAPELNAFLQGDSVLRETLPSCLEKNLQELAGRYAPDLDRCLLEDVVQETWVLLLTRGASNFDAGKGSVSTYVTYMVRDAAKSVRAANTPAGQRTRLQRDDNGNWIPRRPADSLDQIIVREGESETPLIDMIPWKPAVNPYMQICDSSEAKWLLAEADANTDAQVSQALQHIYYDEYNLTKAAQKVQLHHSTLRRRIDRWTMQSHMSLD